ncbi:GntR family transcriptional regulator [Streptomyces sp. NBC_01506]|uniref:GntR family transcriptional regulator n=1 Tax=Streptomyces sp. NBC_01506 TaxID=2903887 RepID=UPI00386AA62D
MAFTPTPIPSRTQYVLEAIKNAILTARLPPGQALVEAELADRFGVSKTPVREALKTLAGTGLVVMSQYKGAVVRHVDATMAREVYDVRLLLEPEALRRSVSRRGRLDAAQVALDRAESAADRADRSLADRDFHRALYLPCGNPLLARTLDEISDQAALVATVAWATVPTREREAAEHREILRLALAGEATAAADALRHHIASFVRRAFPENGDENGDEDGDDAGGSVSQAD